MDAARLAPEVKPYLIAAHQSVEIGHRVILEQLGLRPLLDLEGLKAWRPGRTSGYALLERAVDRFGMRFGS